MGNFPQYDSYTYQNHKLTISASIGFLFFVFEQD